MADTTFVPQTTRISSSWCNSINDFFYTVFLGAETPQAACEAIGAIRVEGTPDVNDIPSWNGTVWVPQEIPTATIPNPLIVEEDADEPQVRLVDSLGTGVAIVYNTTTGVLGFHQVTTGTVGDAMFSFNMQDAIGTAQNAVTADWVVDPT